MPHKSDLKVRDVWFKSYSTRGIKYISLLKFNSTDKVSSSSAVKKLTQIKAYQAWSENGKQ